MKHVKNKKQHEITQLGQTLHMLGTATDCHCIVDVGAGQGHLSRLLTFEHGFRVTTIEAAGCHSSKAQKLDREVHQRIIKKNLRSKKKSQNGDGLRETKTVNNLPEHVTCFIQSDASKSEFLQLVQKTFSQNTDNSTSFSTSHHPLNTSNCASKDILQPEENLQTKSEQKKMYHGNTLPKYSNNHEDRKSNGRHSDNHGKAFILTGLHACGNLTTTMLRVFASSPEVVGLASVSCCYMKLSDSSSSNKEYGYPMSKYVRHLPNHHLSYEAREMACHFVDYYTERLRRNYQAGLKLHCYRAMLQYIIHYVKPDYDHGTIKLSVKNPENLDFRNYAKMGLKRLNLATAVPDDVFCQAESYLPLWKTVVAFYTLRLSLAPVIETLILLDRMVFLYENGISSALVPIFDPKISPRNFVLLAKKSSEAPER